MGWQLLSGFSLMKVDEGATSGEGCGEHPKRGLIVAKALSILIPFLRGDVGLWSRENFVPLLSPGESTCLQGSGRIAGVAQLVERQLPKLKVAGSKPVSRSRTARLYHGSA